ncbi:MAG: hypothetical protein IJI38_11905 [Clostridia bacterium]|nr:hypothetical protein [Clostridia bacterium]
MLCQKGWNQPWHSFDIVVERDQYEAADRVLTRLGMRTPVSESALACETHYHFDGADIQLYAGFPLPDVVYRLPAEAEKITVLSQEVPLLTAEDWFVLLRLSGRNADAEAMQSFFQTQPFRTDALSSPLSAFAPQGDAFPIQ